MVGHDLEFSRLFRLDFRLQAIRVGLLESPEDNDHQYDITEPDFHSLLQFSGGNCSVGVMAERSLVFLGGANYHETYLSIGDGVLRCLSEDATS